MKLNTLKRTMAVSALGLAALLGTSEVANAQNNRPIQKQQQKVYQQQQKVDNQRAKLEQQRIRLEQERLQKQRLEQQRTEQIRLEQQRQQQIRQQQQNQANRYRINRNGRQYQVDNRQAELLRQAVNTGYQQGLRAGQTDKSGRRSNNYNNSTMYKNGNYGYQSYVDSNLYQYYFQQGFQRGYTDGYNSRYQYGIFQNGNANILGTILQGILNLQSF